MRRVDALGTQSAGGDGFGEGIYHTVLASRLVAAKDQVYSGGVGKQPGCPRPCRCGCPLAKGHYPTRPSPDIEV